MAIQSRSPLFDRFIRGKGPLKPRAAALLLMVAGAICFIVSLVSFGDQVLCLLGSTLVVFVGLGIILTARRYIGLEETDDLLAEEPQPARRRINRSSQQVRQPAAQTPAPSSWEEPEAQNQPPNVTSLEPATPSWREHVEMTSLLLQRTIDVLRRQGAEVQIVNQRADRSILHVLSSTQKGYSILIHEGADTIDVSDLRGLNSLMVSSGAEGAIFISANAFTPQAQEWAQKHAVLLVEGSRVEEIEI
jgi:hypothetical protein